MDCGVGNISDFKQAGELTWWEGTSLAKLITILRMTMNRGALGFTAVLATLEYIGCALFYGYLLGLNTQSWLTCPVCPSVTSLETRWKSSWCVRSLWAL